MDDGGWGTSAAAWIRLVDDGDPSRELLLDAVMRRLCGEVSGRRVLDAGCGEGRFSRLLARDGGHLTMVDATREMVRTAHERRLLATDSVRASAAALPFHEQSFDLVVSYIVLVDIPDFRRAITEMARVLAPRGRLGAANISFMSAATGWVRDADGNRLHYPIDNYFDERPQRFAWGGVDITNWHRPLSAYMEAYLSAGLLLREFLEPRPVDDSLRRDPRFEDWYRVPNFTVMSWEKPASA